MKGGVQRQRNSIQSNAQIKESLKKINVRVLTVVGSDDFPGDKTLVAQLVPDACHFQIQGRDHINVVPDPKFHMVVKAFLDYVNKIKLDINQLSMLATPNHISLINLFNFFFH